MTDEERKRIAAERKAAYRKRKKAEALEELSNSLPDKSPQELAALRIAKANGIDVPPGVLYQDHREHARAVQAESVAREEYIQQLFSPYAKVTNIPQLLSAILRELITLRVTLTDLLADGVRR